MWLASITVWFAGQGRGVAPRAGESMVRREHVVDFAGELHPRGDEHDQVVADPLEVGDQVRRQHDAHPLLGVDLHQDLQELASGQRVEARDRLVEDQQLRPLRDRQGQRELRPLAAGQLARLLAVQAELLDPRSASAASQVGFSCAPSRRWSATLSAGTSGCPARRTRPARAAPAPLGRRSAEHPIVPAVGASRPTASCSSVDLPAPFGPTSPTTCPAGMLSVQSDSAHRGRTACRARGPRGRRSCYALLNGGARSGREHRLDALVVEPGSRALRNQRSSRWRSGPCAASVSSLSVLVTNVPTPGRAATRPSCSSSR